METTNVHVNCMPTDPQLERIVAASLVMRPEGLNEVRELLDAESFSDPRNRDIYGAVARITERGERADMVTVADELQRSGCKTGIGYLAESCTGSLVVGDITQHALILRDLAKRRTLWETGLRLMSGAGDMTAPVEETHSEAKGCLDGLFDTEGSGVRTLEQTYGDLQKHILLNRDLPEGATAGTPTGFREIDASGGLCGGDLIVVGAETSQGKTSFATALSLSALRAGESVAFYSMEMTPLQLTARIGAMMSGIRASRLLFGRVEIHELRHLDSQMETLPMGKMLFDGRSTSTLEKILASIRAMRIKYGIQGAVVDYLQLVNSGDRYMSPEQKAAKCARDLKNIAKELGIWIIAISQLRRDPNMNPVPSKARLRDSGQIEEAADNIFLIYRPKEGKSYPEPFQDVETEGTAMITIAKGRNVGEGAFICGFKPETTHFYPIEKPYPKAEFSNTKKQETTPF